MRALAVVIAAVAGLARSAVAAPAPRAAPTVTPGAWSPASQAPAVPPTPPDPSTPAANDASASGSSAGRAVIQQLGSGDVREIERAVGALAQASPEHADPDALFAAARACEDKLLDPARALAIYERIIADHPDARAAVAAARRAAPLRALVGPHGETAAHAAELAQLIARADADPPATVVQRAEQLASSDWHGAPAAALWLAGWLRRSGRLAEAQARYAGIIARWPGRPEAVAALRGGAGCALDARDWSLAETLASRMLAADPTAQTERDELLGAARRGRRHDRWYTWAWLAVAAAFAALIGSLVEAAVRSPPGTRLAALRPPIEIAFLAPVTAVLIGVAFTAHRLIAPAVATIAIGGLGLTWLSGAALEQLRLRGRSYRLRSISHVIACVAAVAGLGYIAVTHGGLLDMLIETVRFGPEG